MLKLIREWRYRRAIRLVRREMACLGYPLDDLTDEEIQQGLNTLADVMSRMGMTIKEASAAMLSCAGEKR